MTLGSKIKTARKSKNMTQSDLAGTQITRNMLSAIECDKATPSLETLTYLAARLSLPISYLISGDDDLFYHEKSVLILNLKNAYAEKNYELCLSLCANLSDTDDEIDLILSSAHFELARRSVLNGSLTSGKRHLETALAHAKKCVYDTSRIETLSLMYSALIENIKAPLLEFDAELFEKRLLQSYDYDFYKYLIGDHAYDHKNPMFSKHVLAKELIKERNYREALRLLKEIENEKTPENYNAYLIFSIYADIENCYKQLLDFENAYRYSSKRISIIEGFNL